ncbi:uncharacterized protein LOC141619680 isoform X2 [Silene latifolia]|uniref:uncharacterized protein LOC141619680 isoform X2 n=1 Tax=Silene latifolia TaxID=37657 RepID=UPI003D76B335
MEDGVGLGVLALVLLVMNSALSDSIANGESVSAVGDPCMRRDSLRVAFESWNFCNEVGQETPGMGSPRAADCFDLCKSKSLSANSKSSSYFLMLGSEGRAHFCLHFKTLGIAMDVVAGVLFRGIHHILRGSGK